MILAKARHAQNQDSMGSQVVTKLPANRMALSINRKPGND
jgi:hypothetical protein